MTSAEIRSRFLKFFEKRGHVIIPSASLVTTNEKGMTDSTLFNTAGMQPLIPYLLGESHPKGKRLVDVQKCLRTVDINDIGDNTHATFFEMLGNWSLGDYFKEDAINWSYEFLTDNNEGLGLDPHRLYVTVFEGDENAEKDEEVAGIWKEIFEKNKIKGERIFYMNSSMNWWQAGDNGPCGPDTEMYYDVINKFHGKGISKEEFIKADEKKEIIEVWNDVFMQYEKKEGEIVGRLPKPSVDTGAGLERLAMVLQSVDNIYDTDLLAELMKITQNLSSNLKSQRIIADHIRSTSFLISDGIAPSNTDRGYILRRLIRRAVFNTENRRLDSPAIDKMVDVLESIYRNAYKNFSENSSKIKYELLQESERFSKVLEQGSKEFDKTVDSNMTGEQAFTLFSSYGLPIEMIVELAKERGFSVDIEGYEEAFKNHQDLSRSNAENKFKGGLADTSEMSKKYHTATHLLHQALHDVLGEGIAQKGSNITPERLRFDFSFPEKLTEEQKQKIQKIVNEKIKQALPVHQKNMQKADAEHTGARHFFNEKYGNEVSIYYIGKSIDNAYSKEFCGGPHVKNTSELGTFKITKEEAVSQGVRRIKAILQ